MELLISFSWSLGGKNENLEAEAVFGLALDRFCALRRVTKMIISDQVTTFTLMQPLLGII